MTREAVSLPRWHWPAIGLFFLWLIFSLGAYYVVQQPLDSATIAAIGRSSWDWSFSLRAVGRSLLDLLAAVWIVLIALGLGLWLWRYLGPAGGGLGETSLLSLGLGFGALGLIVMFVGLAGWLTFPVLLSLSALLFLGGLPVLWPFVKRLAPPPRPSRLVTTYLAIAVVLALTVALLPPTSWDSLSYHLRGPWLYLRAGRIYPGVDVFSLNNPFLLEMAFMLSMSLRSDITAKLIHFVFLFLLSGQVYLLATSGLKLRDGWTAVLLLFTVPMVLQLASISYNDLALAFTILAALYAYIRWREGEYGRWLILSGIFCGLAMSLKYTGFMAPCLIGLMLLAQEWRQPRKLARLLLLFAGPALLVALPWYVKNWAFTGNPVYPFVWYGRFWDEFRSTAHQNPGSGIGWHLGALLTVPFNLTLGVADASGDGPTGPIFLALMPLLLIYTLTQFRRSPLAYRVLLLYAVFHYLFWLVGVINSAALWQGRLMLPALAALCPALAWILHELRRFDLPQFSLRRFLNLVLALVLLFGLIRQASSWYLLDPLAFVVGNQSRTAYLERTLGPLYQASTEMRKILPADAVVQFLWEPRTYYCELNCRGDHILDKYAHLEFLYGSASAIAQALAAEGVTHLFIHEQGLVFLRDNDIPLVVPADPNTFESFLSEYTHPVKRWGNAYSLVKLTS